MPPEKNTGSTSDEAEDKKTLAIKSEEEFHDKLDDIREKHEK